MSSDNPVYSLPNVYSKEVEESVCEVEKLEWKTTLHQ